MKKLIFIFYLPEPFSVDQLHVMIGVELFWLKTSSPNVKKSILFVKTN